jgi:hypothetical protein
MPDITDFHAGQRVFVVEHSLDPVVQKGIVKRNLERFPSSLRVELDSDGPPITCHPDQVLPVNADADLVDEFLDVQDRQRPV